MQEMDFDGADLKRVDIEKQYDYDEDENDNDKQQLGVTVAMRD